MVETLPIDAVLPDLLATLGANPCAVLVAAPGAGKSTRAPLALAKAPWLTGSIVMLEPRRLAARAVAARMAETLGEATGQTVGYRVRLESKVSAATRVEVVTEGIFTRRLQDDASLDGVGLVIFDEFHERSLDADLGLALALDIQRALRPDLKILVMSATIDDQGIAALLGGSAAPAPVIAAPHRPFPVETRYLAKAAGPRLDQEIAAAVRRAVAEEEGSILAFLPGEGEIRRAQSLLQDAQLPSSCDVVPLFGALDLKDQARAIAPSPAGRRKIVLATTIAETSLTIEGVRIVVDGGWKRVPRFDPGRGMTQLATVRVSKASAEQRRGRAGRLEPGVCYRLWTEPEDRGLVPFDAPEIQQADLAPLALDLAAWGVRDPEALAWLTPPPRGAFAQATDLLTRLDARDSSGGITAEGRAMAALPMHPRLAHMVHRGIAMGDAALVCEIAALLSERDILVGPRDADLRTRLTLLERGGAQAHRAGLARVRASLQQIRRQAGVKDARTSTARTGILLALAYPDRIGQRRGGDGRFRLSGGGGAIVDAVDSLAAETFLSIADLDGKARDARVFLAAPVSRAELEDVFAHDITVTDEVAWDSRSQTVVAQRERRLGALVLEALPLSDADPERMMTAVLAGIRELGLQTLPWSRSTQMLRERVAVLRAAYPEEGWPDLSEAALLETLPDWLGPFLDGVRRREHFGRIDLDAALQALLPWPLPARLDELAPTHIRVPSGSVIAIDYSAEGGPAVQVKLQEMFGRTDAMTIADGRVPLTVHLLSPAQRPLAVTRDLASFWKNVYPQVRGEMRSRYPRHIWPENPLEATAVRRTIQPRKR
jgi:ATP-dependent helicase HrpB